MHLFNGVFYPVNDFDREEELANLFLVGYPRSGTTYLANIFSSLDDIFVPKIKEPKFFDSRYTALGMALSNTEYCKLYVDSTERYRLDGSTSYISSPDFYKALQSFPVDVKCIICLRKPSEAAFSLYNRLHDDLVDRRTQVKWTLPVSFRTDYEYIFDPIHMNNFLDAEFKHSTLLFTFNELLEKDFDRLKSFLKVDIDAHSLRTNSNQATRFKNKLVRNSFHALNAIYLATGLKFGFGIMRWIKNITSKPSSNGSVPQWFMDNNPRLIEFDIEFDIEYERIISDYNC